MRVAIFALFVSFATFASVASGAMWQDGSLSDATARAARDNKLVFVDVYATWCGPCQDMDTDVYPRAEVNRLLTSDFVALRRDGERGEGLSIAQRYHVLGFPTMLVLDGNGAEIDRVTGGMSANDLVRTLEKIRQGKGALVEAERALARAPTDALRAEVAQRHALRGDARGSRAARGDRRGRRQSRASGGGGAAGARQARLPARHEGLRPRGSHARRARATFSDERTSRGGRVSACGRACACRSRRPGDEDPRRVDRACAERRRADERVRVVLLQRRWTDSARDRGRHARARDHAGGRRLVGHAR